MNITLHMAISVDGFVARKDGDSGWVSNTDAALFEKRCKEAGCIVLGRTTFDQYQGELYPIEGITNIVLSRTTSAPEKDVFFVDSPAAAIKLAQSKGHDHILLAGGGATNGAFLKAGLIDEIFLSVHSIVLGSGVPLFGPDAPEAKLTLLDTEKLDDNLVQLHYAI